MKTLKVLSLKPFITLAFIILSIYAKAQISFTDNGQTLGQRISSGVDLGDIDNDGDLDAFVINGEWNAEQPNDIWINDGQGNFTISNQTFGNSKAGKVDLGDLDGDGDLDAFIGYYNFLGGEPNQVWFNDGNGFFTDSGQRMGKRNGSTVLADLDNDGDLDAFNCNHVYDSNGIYINGGHQIWLNNGSGIFTDSGQDFGNGWNTNVALGDIDGDSDIDAVVAANAGTTGNTIWLNDGQAEFSKSDQILLMTFSMDVALGDLDKDSDLDIVIIHQNEIKIWLNDGKGTFTESGQKITETSPQCIELGDLDKDGDLDAFIACGAWQVKYPNKVWINDGHGFFTSAGISLGYDESQDIKLGDLDSDGDLDAFVANTGGNKVYINTTDTIIETIREQKRTSDLNGFFYFHPNPSTGIFNVTFGKTLTQKAIIEVYSLQGKLIFAEYIDVSPDAIIDLNCLPNGMYVIKTNVNNEFFFEKLLKE